MAITVTTRDEDIVGKTRMITGTITSDALTAATFDTGLSNVSSISITPSPALAVTAAAGVITVTPVITGVMYFTVFGY